MFILSLLLALLTPPNDYFDHITAASEGRLTRFERMPVQVFVQEAPHQRLTAYVDAVHDAMRAWEEAGEGVIRFQTIAEEPKADIVVLWSREPLRLQRRSRIAEASLIRRRGGRPRVEIQVNLRQWPSLELWDVESVRRAMLHEFGHALGLWGHSPDPGDALYYASDQDHLSARDRATLRRVYATPVGTPFHAQALASLQARIDRDPADARAYYLLGTVWADQGDYERAISAFQRALERDPTLEAYAANLGRIFQQQGHLDAAIQEYLRALRAHPTASYHGVVGMLYLLQDRFERATFHYEQATRMDPQDEVLRQNLLASYHRWATHLLKQRAYAQAGGLLERALLRYPFSPLLNYDRAVAYEGMGAYHRAIEQYEYTLSLDDRLGAVRIGLASAWNNLGAQHARAQEWNEAIRCYEKALEWDEDCWEAQRNLEMSYLQQAWQQHAAGNLQAAIATYQRVLRLNPESSDAHNNLGLVYLKQKRYDEALKSLERALALDPQSRETEANLKYVRRQRWITQLRGVFLPVFGILFLSYLLMRWTTRRVERS